MNGKNVFAILVILAVLIGGGAAIYKLDNGQGNRTSQNVADKTASD